MYVVAAVLVALGGRRLGAKAFWLAALGPVWTVGYALWLMSSSGSMPRTESWQWVGALGLTIEFRVDWFSVIMLLLVGGIGTLVFLYSVTYFAHHGDVRRTAIVLSLFAGAMTGLVTSDNLLLLFTFWELTSITSFLLIGSADEKAAARSAALHALLVTGAGGLAMLGGFVLLGEAAGTYSLHALLSDPPSGTLVTVALVLVLMGALTKSAQVPFHAWLPGAMSAPTPISAYLHSATMVKAGVYLVARFAPAFATVGPWRWIVLGCGGASLLVGGYRALRQNDIKLILAYGTISQLGLLMILFGAGTADLALAGCVLLIAHAVFKAALFMTVGIVDHETHTRDRRVLTGLGRRWPLVTAFTVLAAASMAGIPPLFGFVAKELALEGLLEPGTPVRITLLVVVVVGSMLTVAYTARFLWGAFGPADHDSVPVNARRGSDAPRASVLFALSPAILAVVGVVWGLQPDLLSALVGDGWAALGYDGDFSYLSLWHGFTAALGLSMIAIVGGAVLFVGRRGVSRLQAVVRTPLSAQGVYDSALRGLLRGAGRLTAFTQSGSLPVYLMVLLATLVVVPGVPLVLNGGIAAPAGWIDSPVQVILAVIMIVSALAAAATRRRFAAVLLIGAVGYGMSGLFIVQGAPDLALTQVLVETLGVVAFVLVLRHLPEGFASKPSIRRRVIPAVAGVVVGVFVFWFALASSAVTGTPTPDPARAGTESVEGITQGETPSDGASLSEEYLLRSYPEGHGRNVVNVILVDFRAFDTLGEITVLFVAALGIVALIQVGRRDRRRDGPPDANESAPVAIGGTEGDR